MAVLFDTSVAGSLNAAGTTILPLSLTVSSSANRLMLAGIATSGTGSGGGGGTVVSVTYAGNSLTKIGTIQSGTAATDRILEVWRLTNPPAGAGSGTITVSVSGFPVVAGFETYTGVDQTTPCASIGSSKGSATSVSGTVTSAVGDIIADFVANRGTNIAVGASQTQMWSGSAVLGGTNMIGASSRMAGAAHGTPTWTITPAGNYAYVSLDIQAAAVAVTTRVPYFDLMGAGY